MMARSFAKLIALTLLCGALGACGKQAASDADIPRTPSDTTITFKVNPDLPWSDGDKVEVSVTKAGAPVVDAEVGAVFYMPAMPSMNMPEMRSTYRLRSIGDGAYRGSANLSMGGEWAVTVTALRGGEKLGSEKFSVFAK